MPHIHRTGFTRLADGDGPDGPDRCNIIFVHGLRGHPQRTWGDDVDDGRASTSSQKSSFKVFRSKRKEINDDQSRNHPYWPYELLPTDVPDARIWTYGYNADVAKGVFRANNRNSVSQHGQDLMVKLGRVVKEGPIIFVAHSLGGIIVKDAIYRDEALQQQTRAVVFLGTPHRGASAVDWAQMASNLAAVALQDSNKTITEALRVDSEVLDNIHRQFIKIMTKQDIRVHSFQEARGMLGVKGVSGKVVSDFSSALGLPDETVETLDADHRQMVKCTGRDDPRYTDISGVLKELLWHGGRNCSATPDSKSPPVSSSSVRCLPLINEEDKRHSSDQTLVQPNTITSTEKIQRKDIAFRVRGVPVDWEPVNLESFLAAQDTAARPVVRSLARETHGRSLSATVTFQRIPSILQDIPTGKTWDIPVHNRFGARPESLSLDADFSGMTTLFAPPCKDHKVDVIAVSGLGGHAFGSFKEKDSDHMWLRDALPFDLTNEATDQPMARVVTYDYNSTVANSHSTQNLDDLATALHTSLRLLADGPSRRIIFVAHSLGGLIVKQVLSILDQSRDAKDQQLLRAVYGIAFFGVPHHGMDIKSLIPMAGDRPNRFLIESISDKQPQVLHRQHEDFVKALGKKGQSEVVCFYETMESPTAQKGESGEWEMTGPRALLVTSFSATNCRPWEHGLEHVCAINRTHSDMVKFGRHDPDYDNVCERLRGLACRALTEHDTPNRAAVVPPTEGQLSNASHFLVDLAENRRFVGRETVLADLRDALFDDCGPQTMAVVGLGGVGKTQVALQIAFCTKGKPGWSVFWLPALSMAGFEQACTQMAGKLSIPTSGQEDAKELVRRYLDSSRSGRWLLIIDNADNLHTVFGAEGTGGIYDHLSRNTNGRILFTTRSRDVAWAVADDDTVELEEMSEREARDFLHKLLPKDLIADNRGIVELLRALTFLPLAISQAAAYIKRNRTPMSKYLSLLRDSDKEAISLLSREFPDRTRNSESRHAVMTTWLVSFQQIQGTDWAAAQLLSFISQVEPRAIPETMLPRTETEEELENAVGTLSAYAFLQRREDGKTLDMHSLVHLAAREWVHQGIDKAKIRQAAVTHLATVFKSDDWDDRERWRQYMPHVLKMLRDGGGTGKWGDECQLGFWAGRCLRVEGRIPEAVDLLEHVVKVQETTLAENHPDRLASQHALAGAYEANGQVKEAVDLLEHVVKVGETTLAENHPDRLASQHVLAGAYRANGQVKEAVDLLEHVVKVRETTLAENHLDRLASQHALAGAYQANGQVREAVDLLEHVVKLEETTLAENHPSRLASQHELAGAYQANGQVKEAVDLLEHVVRVREIILAEKHPSRLVSQHALAGAYKANGQAKEAIDLLEHVVKVEETTLAENHPSRLASQHELAGAYQANGQVKEAVDLLEHVVKVEETTLAENHPSRLASQHALAGAYKANGQVKEAVDLLEYVVKVRESTLAENHPSRLASQHTLAGAYEANGQVKEAVDLLEHVVKVGETTLAENHPDRLASQHVLAGAYRANGQVKEAVDLLEHVVKVRETTLAENHPDRLASQHVLAGTYRANGQVKEAVDLLEHVVKVQETTLAENHPDRLASQHALAGAYQANGQVREAVDLLEHVVKLEETTLAENHPDRLASQHALAGAYKANGQVKEAIDLLEHVVRVRETILAENHPSRLASQHALAGAYKANGQAKEAIDLLKHVVKVQETTTLAENHPFRLASQHALAGAYEANGQVREAIDLLEHVVRVRETTLAENHPDRLASQHALAGAYKANGQVREAVDLLEHVVKVEETTLAENHPSRLASQHALAGAYKANGHAKEAIDLLEHVVRIRSSVMAHSHSSRRVSDGST